MSNTAQPDEVDKILVDLYLGREFRVETTDWAYQMSNPKLQAAKAALNKLRLQDRIDELVRIGQDYEHLAGVTLPDIVWDKLRSRITELSALKTTQQAGEVDIEG